ncbi:glutamate--cysteine ligase [Alkalilimnicola ehrlichii]|uniref:Glutamate--cysteine ligase n=1 Tax=Alkalilimnicola ehrlichii TaxID=351052 RepID=A0A3E0WWP3_9GAMM|nr:glutamate--cysteine ligase [Alkalilimnicola ehrlichii]RFA29838.1 glutamate--cysteine ligase [Alkalilimnicola ehrlichii]RFA36426.1 glutamate--cysteine ligase [Alkalilimnicola ehrlichii]
MEKESLRVNLDGEIAQTPHPRALGSALTHPCITTDYSEALLEFITPPYPELSDTLRALGDIHAFVYRNLDQELLWATSMPCVVGGDESIPIAEYGSSNVGRMKHIYRRGLDHRYGRIMQAIAGVHFNYSLPEAFWPAYQRVLGEQGSLKNFRSEHYFRLIRNFQRHGWLISYLFGASPALCRSFLAGREHNFAQFEQHTLYAPHATSLRMSDIGYKNKAQAGLKVCYNTLETYIASLTRAITTPAPDYAAIGTQVDGTWRQLNTNILQIENEYYSFIRPKAVAESGERPTLALDRAGVEYVEIRALDVNAFDPMGLDAAQLRFIEAFLLLCLLQDSPPIDHDEQAEIGYNQAQVAVRGREPGLTLRRRGEHILLSDWATHLCEAMAELCEILDQNEDEPVYQAALDDQIGKVRDPDLTPSALMLSDMREHNESFIEFALRLSTQHAAFFRRWPLSTEARLDMEAAAAASIREQAAIEAADTLDFETYLANYFAQQ